MILLPRVLLVGFAGYLYGLSGLSEQRAQTNLRKSFERALGQAIAPVGPVSEGTPVAALGIPRLGLTRRSSSRARRPSDLAHGPGHRADTVLPGQTGVSVVYGRRVELRRPVRAPDATAGRRTIAVTTGQGCRLPRLVLRRRRPPGAGEQRNRLVLTTADSTGVAAPERQRQRGSVSTPQPAGGRGRPFRRRERLAAASDARRAATLLWSQALLARDLVAVRRRAAGRRSRPAVRGAARARRGLEPVRERSPACCRTCTERADADD